MNYEQFLEQMKDDLMARFARDLPPKLFRPIRIIDKKFIPNFIPNVIQRNCIE